MNQRILKAKTVFGILLVTVFFCSGRVYAEASSDAALDELQRFLNDPARRAAFSQGRSEATQANQFLGAFPAWVQQEILDINMMIMREKRENAVVHQAALAQGGVAGAMKSFSPPVQARINALVKRLENDKSFNNPQQLNLLKQQMPQFLVMPGS
jgi:hypothetical protein